MFEPQPIFIVDVFASEPIDNVDPDVLLEIVDDIRVGASIVVAPICKLAPVMDVTITVVPVIVFILI